MKKWLATLSIATVLLTSASISQVRAVETTTGYPQGKAYESGGYQEESGIPVIGNWSQNVPFAGTETNKVKWEKDITNFNYIATSTVDKDGNLYYTSNGNEIISLDNKGAERWKLVLEDPTSASPVIGKDGTIYIQGGKFLYALNKDGEIIRKTSPSSGLTFGQTPAIDKDGILYSVSGEKKLYAFNPDGSVKWKSVALPQIDVRLTPIISKDGNIYVKTSNYLFAFNKDGSKKWELSVAGESQISLLDDGEILVPDSTQTVGMLRIINPDGTKHKELTLSRNGGKFALKSDYNDQILAQEDYNLVSYNIDGTKNWTYQTSGQVSSTPLIDKNGVIYIASNDGIVTALHPDGKEKWHINLRIHYNASTLSFKLAPYSISMDSNGNLHVAIQIFKDSKLSYKFISIGEDKTTEEGNMCKGYLEEVEQKIKDGSITKEEINAAQLRLSKTLYDLSQKESK